MKFIAAWVVLGALFGCANHKQNLSVASYSTHTPSVSLIDALSQCERLVLRGHMKVDLSKARQPQWRMNQGNASPRWHYHADERTLWIHQHQPENSHLVLSLLGLKALEVADRVEVTTQGQIAQTLTQVEVRDSAIWQHTRGSLHLSDLLLQDFAKVDLQHTQGDIGQVTAENHTTMTWRGILKIHQLHVSDHAYVHGNWLNGGQCVAHVENQAKLELSGVSDLFDLTAEHHAHVFVRFLRAQSSYVKAYHHAVVDMASTQEHYISTHDDSRVFHYDNLAETFNYEFGDSITHQVHS